MTGDRHIVLGRPVSIFVFHLFVCMSVIELIVFMIDMHNYPACQALLYDTDFYHFNLAMTL